jgi:alkylated DNA repair dioxygenase AlkB
MMKQQRLAIPHADLQLFLNVWSDAEAKALWPALHTLDWQQKAITLFGRAVMQPRLIAWYGDAGADYRYSGLLNIPQPWTPVLQAIRERVQSICQVDFNSVLGNWYRDGHDSVGWHSDDEPELGPQPIIASVSFGVTRRFSLQHKKDKALRFAIDLPNASLLLMQGETQQHYRHAVLKDKAVKDGRINLTFRQILR